MKCCLHREEGFCGPCGELLITRVDEWAQAHAAIAAKVEHCERELVRAKRDLTAVMVCRSCKGRIDDGRHELACHRMGLHIITAIALEELETLRKGDT